MHAPAGFWSEARSGLHEGLGVATLLPVLALVVTSAETTHKPWRLVKKCTLLNLSGSSLFAMQVLAHGITSRNSLD